MRRKTQPILMSGEFVSWNEFPVLLALFGFLALPKSSLILPLRPWILLATTRAHYHAKVEEKVAVISGGATGIALATA